MSCWRVVFCRTVAEGLGDHDGYLFVIFLTLLGLYASFLHPKDVVISLPVFLISIQMQQRAEVNSSVVSLIKLVRALVLLHPYFVRSRKRRSTK